MVVVAAVHIAVDSASLDSSLGASLNIQKMFNFIFSPVAVALPDRHHTGASWAAVAAAGSGSVGASSDARSGE